MPLKPPVPGAGHYALAFHASDYRRFQVLTALLLQLEVSAMVLRRALARFEDGRGSP